LKQVKKQRYEKAAELFYKAYLYDPSDPFTLNNLGYVSELQGELDRAHKFYAARRGAGMQRDH
jgi:Flp pilus assembly protein TadD